LRLLDASSELEQLQGAGELAADFSRESAVNGSYLRTIPGVHPTDGFFVAMLRKEV
jgi:16S rRNA C967 or C1407 C5-methylase (RsmB/RsmF family)